MGTWLSQRECGLESWLERIVFFVGYGGVKAWLVSAVWKAYQVGISYALSKIW